MARLAKSLEDLRAEYDQAFPSRNKASDGWLGDASHRDRASRHNPNSKGDVTALDITSDPGAGARVHDIADFHRRNPHPDLSYIISHRRIAGRHTNWEWRPYTGSNPHITHVHYAVGTGTDSNPKPPYNTRASWRLAECLAELGIAAQTRPSTISTETATLEDNMTSPAPRTLRKGDNGHDVRVMQALLIAHGNVLTVDGDFGPRTEKVLKDWQARTNRLRADGECGPKTWQWLTGIALQGGNS